MNNELVIKKCLKCGALVRVLNDCTCDNCGIKCCNEQMKKLIPNSSGASEEKHIPKYKKVDKEINVTLNHPMEEDHFIEWISLVHQDKEEIVFLHPGDKAECKFNYIPGSTIYSYCNKHELWKKDVI